MSYLIYARKRNIDILMLSRYEEWLEVERIELDYQYSLEEMEEETQSTLGGDLFKIFLDK